MNVLNGKRILVVEDDPLTATDLLQSLEAMGADVAGPFSRVDDALRRLDDAAPVEGAILDIQVGGDVVYRLVDRLRLLGVPVIFATGVDERDIPEAYRDVARYPKPYRIEDMVRGFVAPQRPPA